MCTQYVNANTALFKSVTKNNNEVVGFFEPFDCIVAENNGNVLSIKDFNIITYINMLESNGRHAKNILDRRETLQVCIRFTKCTKNDSERLSIDLDTFEIITKDSEDIVYDACVPYLNYKRITHIENIDLDIENPKGSYVVKVLVKTLTDTKYTVQSIYHLKIE